MPQMIWGCTSIGLQRSQTLCCLSAHCPVLWGYTNSIQCALLFLGLYLCLLLLVPNNFSILGVLLLGLLFCAQDIVEMNEDSDTLMHLHKLKAHLGKIGIVCADAVAEHTAVHSSRQCSHSSTHTRWYGCAVENAANSSSSHAPTLSPLQHTKDRLKEHMGKHRSTWAYWHQKSMS